MTGRGKPRKAKSPDTTGAKIKTRPEEMKQGHLARCSGKDFTEETQVGTTKEQKPKERKTTNYTEEKPSVQKTKKHVTDKIDKQDKTPTAIKKAPVQGAKTKTTKQSVDEIKTRPETPKDTTKAKIKTTKAKACGGRAKSPVEFAEELQPETPKDARKPKPRAGKAKAPEQIAEKTAKGATKACVPQARCEDKAAVDTILHTTLEKLKIKQNEKANASKVVNKITEHIMMHLKNNTQCFQEVQKPLRTGSYYENLKISNPDEFDVMLPIPVDRVTIEPFGDNGAFYSVGLKRGESPLKKFQEKTTLSASEMLKEFRKEVKISVKEFTEWKVEKKKPGCPAVTLITQVQSVTISLDVVLSLVVKSSWPQFTTNGLQIKGWLGAKVKQEYKREPYYLVPKYEGKGRAEHDGVLAKDGWRISFSHIEKAIVKNHGSEKTCCEKAGARCCRKDCLKLLKHLLSLLKEKDSSLDKFCSYHAKTTLLHACCSRTRDTDWRASDLSHCFQLLLEDFVAHLEKGVLHNFFIPSQNLLSGPVQKKCNSLACYIREELDEGFPIFK